MLNITGMERDLAALQARGGTLLASSLESAREDDRELTDEERAAVQAIADQGAALKAKIARAKGDEGLADAIAALVAAPTQGLIAQPTRQQMLSLGSQFVASEAYDFFKKGGHRTSAAWRSPSIELDAATLTEDPASGGSLILPDYQSGVLPLLYRPMVVGNLFAPGRTDSNLISYMQEKAFTNAAAPVLEGAAKPESALTFEPKTEPVRKLAHWLPVTEEMLEDAAQIRSYIDARLRLGVQLAEENQLLNGTGIAPEILGLNARTGVAAPIARGAAESNVDAIFRQIMAIWWTAFLPPDGIVMNPADWGTVALMKTTTGEYMAGSPFAGQPTFTLWGLRVALTPLQTVASAWVGAFKTGGQVFRRGGIRVEASNSHQDFFIKNLVAIRAEERLALAIYRPQAFGKVTNLGVPTVVGMSSQGQLGGGAQGQLGEGGGHEELGDQTPAAKQRRGQ